MKNGILTVANWDSDVGYAWWLMESFWVKIDEHFNSDFNVYLAYPSISVIPEKIKSSNLIVVETDFTFNRVSSILGQIEFLIKNKIRYIYLSDRNTLSWRYPLYRLVGVKKIILHVHTPGERTRPTLFKQLVKTLINKVPFISVNYAIGATEYVKQRLINVECLPRNRCYAVQNGVPLLNEDVGSDFDVHNYFKIPTSHKIIVSVGRANYYKGVDFALSTINVLVKEFGCNEINFLFIGDGPHLLDFIKLANELGVSDFVTFAGKVAHVEKILAHCDIAYHPSKGEVGYSLSILEYMRAALPVVVSDNPSVCGATENEVDGLIYQQGDFQSAARAIYSLIEKTELSKKLGEAGAEKINKEYSIECCHSELTNTLDLIIK